MASTRQPQKKDTPPPPGQTYEFYPLPTPSHIRLLSLDPSTSHYTLNAVNLTTTPPPTYTCLSYTWAHPSWPKLTTEPLDVSHAGDRTESLLCSGQTILITPNLLSALARLHDDIKTTPIWIDALCIHQESATERSAQVARMDSIYRSAQKVIIWLGPEDENYTEVGIEVLSRLAGVREEQRTQEIPGGLMHRDIYTKLGISPPVRDFEWLALGELLMRTWFRRMWVIQELFEARDVVVYCGRHVIEWADIVKVSELLRVSGLGRALMGYLEMVTSVEGDGEEEGEVYVGNTVTNQWLFESLREQKGEVRLETLLSYARYFGATCRSDYFYAVRGMWNPSSALLKELRESIKPDYKVPVEDVFTAATYASIVEAGDLNILCLVEDYSLREASGIEEKMNLPSWVPDWSITPIADPLAMNPRPEKGEERWTAGRSLPYSTPLAPIDGHLGVTGVEVSIITSTAEDNEIFGLLEFLSLLSSNPTQAEKIIESFWRTIIKDTYRDQPASESARRAFKGYLSARVYELGEETEGIEELLNEISVRDKSGTMPSWEEVSEVIEKEKGDREFKGVNEEERFFGESVRVACVGRTMFWTGGEEVGELGLGPLETNVGDRVWVLAGMDVPVVLRKVEEGWRFIGECFLGSLVEGIGGRRGEVKDAVLV